MTAIQGFIPASRRPGELGIIRSTASIFRSPISRWRSASIASSGWTYRPVVAFSPWAPYDHPHVWGTISEGPRKKFGYCSFGAFEDDIDRFATRLQDMKIKRLDPPPGVQSNGLWFNDHDGNLVEVKVAAKSSPDEKTRFLFREAAAGERGAPFRSALPRTRPRRLSHVLLFTRDVPKAMEFYTRVLGLRVSDYSGENVAFLHGIHGSDHHMIAFARSDAPGLHHLSWDVGSVDEIGAGAMHMLGKGLRQRLGTWTPRSRLELFPLRARSVGQPQRIFRRHRLCSSDL